jgi:hypothetical protein
MLLRSGHKIFNHISHKKIFGDSSISSVLLTYKEMHLRSVRTCGVIHLQKWKISGSVYTRARFLNNIFGQQYNYI